MSADLTPVVEHYESHRFEQSKVRVFTIDGRKLAVGADICAALDIKNSRDALARLDSDDRVTIGRSDTVGCSDGIWNGFAPQVQSVTLITENGTTDLILESRKPEARRFRRWLTHEVWPSIRNTGSYGVAALDLSDPIAAIEAAHAQAGQAIEIAKAERDRAERAERRAAELQPSAAAWDELAEAGADYEVADAAKVLSRDPNIKIGRDRLFAYMAGLDWVYRGHRSRWRAYQSQVDLGRLAEKVGKPYWCPDLEKLVTPEPTVRITSKGLAELYKRLGGGTQLALVATS